MLDEGRKVGDIPESTHVVTKVPEKIAKRKGTLITSVALAYVMLTTPYVFPVVGGRKIEHLKSDIEALDLELSEVDAEEIEGAAPFDRGFPTSSFDHNAAAWTNNIGGHYKYVRDTKVRSLLSRVLSGSLT
jgi:diketogulonate reductase-like aldo/keto reductase